MKYEKPTLKVIPVDMDNDIICLRPSTGQEQRKGDEPMELLQVEWASQGRYNYSTGDSLVIINGKVYNYNYTRRLNGFPKSEWLRELSIPVKQAMKFEEYDSEWLYTSQGLKKSSNHAI